MIAALLLLSLAVANLDFYVESIPHLEIGLNLPNMYAGTIDIEAKAASESMFFWLQESFYKTDAKGKTIIWFNGGPGCSSLDGALLELGMLRFNGPNNVTYNYGNWAEYMNILFIDQPLGTGFSKVGNDEDYAHDLEQAADYVNKFLSNWLEIFPSHAHDDFYVGGESYAGQYIPYIYKKLTAVEPKGILLINPWLDSAHQYLSYVPFVKNHNILTDPQEFAALESMEDSCRIALGSFNGDQTACDKLSNFIVKHSTNDDKTCINIYSYNLVDSFPSCGMNWPEGVNDMPAYLNDAEVRESLHINHTDKWTECSGEVSRHWNRNKFASASELLPSILEEVPVLIMVGDLDYICNWDGLKSYAYALTWNGERGFNVAPEPVLLKDREVGTYQTERNLTLARVYNGTHMIPVNKQFESRQIVHNFMGITEYEQKNTPTGSPKEEEHQAQLDGARTTAYKRAGFTALFVVLALIIVFIIALKMKGDLHISWHGFTGGFARALLHVGKPKRLDKAFEYVSLDRYRSGRPSTIIEEDEEDFEV